MAVGFCRCDHCATAQTRLLIERCRAHSVKRPPWEVCAAEPWPAPCGFRLGGAAYGGVWAASGRGGRCGRCPKPWGAPRVAHGADAGTALYPSTTRSATRSSAPTCAPTCSSSATSSPSSGPSSYHHSPSFSRTRVTPERGAVGSGHFAKVRKKEPIDFAQKLLERPNFSQKIPGCPMMAFCSGVAGRATRRPPPQTRPDSSPKHGSRPLDCHMHELVTGKFMGRARRGATISMG